MWKNVLAALITILTVIALYLLLAQDQDTFRVEIPYGAGDRQFPEYVAVLTGAALTTGNRFEMLVDGEQIFPRMLKAIEEANERISLESYIYESGSDVAGRFDAALEAAARRGVEVNLVFDAMGSPNVEEMSVPRLQTAGCKVALFNKPAYYAFEEVNYRTHRKIMVVDGRLGYTGGVGMSDNWIGRTEDGKRWRDTQFEVAGPAVRFLEGGFAENFIEAAANSAVTPRIGSPLPEPGADDQTIVVWSSPTGGGSALKHLYLLSIAGARRTLDIASPYFLLDESTEDALDRALRRGVKVRVLVEGDVTDAKPVKYSSRAAYERLLGKGIEIYEYQPTLMHSKTIVVDGAWVMFGSANFDNRSLELNDELNVATQTRSLAGTVTTQFNRDLERARRLNLGEWRRRPWIEKAREWVWSHFAEVF